MGKFDAIDIIFIFLISFYLCIFTVIFVLLIIKFHGLKGFFRYLLSDNDTYVSDDKNKVTIEEFIKKKNKLNKKEKKILKTNNKSAKVASDDMNLTNKEKKTIRKYIDDILDKFFSKDKKKVSGVKTKKKKSPKKEVKKVKSNTKNKTTGKVQSSKKKTAAKKVDATKKKVLPAKTSASKSKQGIKAPTQKKKTSANKAVKSPVKKKISSAKTKSSKTTQTRTNEKTSKK